MKKGFVWNLTSTSIAAIAFYAVCGVLLLILPTQAVAIANYAIAGVMILAGALCIIDYFRDQSYIGKVGVRLATGLALICFAVLMFCYPTFLAQLLPKIWGLSLLIGGFAKIQMSVDLKRLGDQKWWLMLIGAAFSFALGVLCIANPVFITEFVFQFIGASLLVEAVLDLVAVLVIRQRIRQFDKAVKKATATVIEEKQA